MVIYNARLFPEKPIGHGRFNDLEGRRFGRLLVVTYAGTPIAGRISHWLCKCDCGRWRCVSAVSLNQKATLSCGCYRSENTRKMKYRHGFSRTGTVMSKLRAVWGRMLSRCFNKSDPSYFRYGGRGITVCERWVNSFEAFIDDMGPRPNGYTLERENNDGNYEPGNCEWATRLAQANNMRSNRRIAFNGKTMNMRQWARELGISHHTLNGRINRHGWPIERALTEPLHESLRRGKR